MAALVVDVDHFHRVIARFGDEGGETLMGVLAERMRDSLPEDVFLARVGGDRFGLVLSVDDEGHAEVSALVAAADIQAALRESICVADEDIFVTASIGVALGGCGVSAAQLLHDTDLAVAIAKRAGGSTTRVFRAGMNNQLAFQLLRERDVRLAVNRDEFTVFFQPIVDVATGQLHAFESLLRWRNPEEGLLPPSTFMDVLEETKLIEVVGRRVIRESCRQAARWLEQTGTLAPVSVNVAPLQLNAADFCDHIALCLDEFQLPGAALIVELTENAFIADKAGVRNALTRLRALGVHVYIDDFGTGYSALAYLHELPVTGVKLDRRWFRSIDTLADQREIVRLIVELAHRMAIDVVVEGIETRSQLETAQRLGCDFAQGYWFARPLDPDQASEYLAALTPMRTSSRTPAPALLPTWAENARRRLQDWARAVSIVAFGTHSVRLSVSP